MDRNNPSASELDTYLKKIQNLFLNEQNDSTEKIRILKLENWDLKQELEKFNNSTSSTEQLREENKRLKEQNSSLEKKLNEANGKVRTLEEKRSSDQRKFLLKIKQWENYMKTFHKLCKCNISSSLNYSIETVNLDYTHKQTCTKDVASCAAEDLIPMTKYYRNTSSNFTSTPIAVGEVEIVECPPEIGSDDDTMWPASPSIVSDNKSDASPSLFDNHQETSEVAVFKKPQLASLDLFKRCDSSVNSIVGKEKILTVNGSYDGINAVLLCQNDPRNNCNPRTSKSDRKNFVLENSGDLFSDDSVSLLINDEQHCQHETPKGISIISPDINRTKQVNLSNRASVMKPKIPNLEDSWLTEDIDDGRRTRGHYKYVEVVRKKEDREKLNGYNCQECRKYYASDNLTESQLKEVLKNCSKHRQQSSPPPDTPEEFWDIDFPTTQECIRKGYLLDEDLTLPDYAKPKLHRGKSRKKIKYN